MKNLMLMWVFMSMLIPMSMLICFTADGEQVASFAV